MYKRCISDETGLEPKNLFYLVQFMMFDLQDKKYITPENTYELIYLWMKMDKHAFNKECGVLWK